MKTKGFLYNAHLNFKRQNLLEKSADKLDMGKYGKYWKV